MNDETWVGRGGEVAAVWVSQGADLMDRFARTRQPKALERALELFRAAVAALPEGDPNRLVALSNLVGALMTLHSLTGLVEPLRESVEVGRVVVATRLADHPEPAAALSNLAIALQALYEREGDPALLDEAAGLLRRAVAMVRADDPRRGGMLANLSGVLRSSAELRDRADLLDEAVRLAREAVATLPPDERAGALSGLAVVLRDQYRRSGRLELLEQAVERGRAAVAASPPRGAQRGLALLNCAGLVRQLGARTQDPALLDEAIGVLREAAAILPASHTARPSTLSNLGLALRESCLRTGQLAQLHNACAVAAEAASTAGPGDARYGGYLANLCLLLDDLAERTERPEISAAAVEAGRRAVAATPPGHAGTAARLDILAHALGDQAQRTGERAPLVEAVQHATRAVAATTPTHVERARYLGNLAGLQLDLALRADAPDDGPGDVETLRAALTHAREALRLDREDDSLAAGHALNIAGILVALADRPGEPEDLTEAIAHCRLAATSETAPLRDRIRGYRLLAALLTRRAAKAAASQAGPDVDGARDARPAAAELRREALAAVDAAVDLLPRLTARHLSRHDREHAAGLMAGLPAQAAAAALDAGQPLRAVELLEQTRGVLVADTLDARSGEAARLRAHSRTLWERFEAVRAEIRRLDDDAGSRWSAEEAPGTAARGEPSVQELRAEQRLAVQRSWQALLDEIRTVPELADFLRPPDVASLAAAAEGGAAVFVHADPSRCDALLLRPGASSVTPVALPGLRVADVARAVALLRRGASDAEMEHVCVWLWETVAAPVLAALDASSARGTAEGEIAADGTAGNGAGNGTAQGVAAGHGTAGRAADSGAERSEGLPRIWWCPVGALAHLPLHAAGRHGVLDPEHSPLDGEPRRLALLDRAVSSYTPTLRALADARARDDRPAPRAARATVIVAAPKVRPYPVLRGVEHESRLLRSLVPGAVLLHRPRRDSVLEALRHGSVVHFACHGVTVPADPAAGHLVLPDHATAPLTVATVNDLQLTGATLAYLSACSTAVTSTELSDEAVHLTAAFHLAGFRGVIGTLWPVDDNVAYEVAEAVYTHLTDEGAAPPDYAGAALALHHAVRAARRLEGFTRLTRWAAHLHTGA